LIIFGNRALKRKFRQKREVKGEWRKQHKEELHNFNSSPDTKPVSVIMRLAGHVTSMKKMRDTYKIFVGET
jgi:hypothetical protein